MTPLSPRSEDSGNTMPAVTDHAITRIKAMITTGELTPGERLPPEKELSEMLGVSRSSLREAVKALQLIRVLDVRRGDGTYVTALDRKLLLEAVSFIVDFHNDASVLEVLDVRRMLEAAAAARAATRMGEKTISDLRSELRRVSQTTSVEDLVEHDLLFHRTITEAAGNGYLVSLTESLASATVRARIWRGITQSGAIERTLADHTAILEAIEARDPDLASAHTAAHIAGLEQWLGRVRNQEIIKNISLENE